MARPLVRLPRAGGGLAALLAACAVGCGADFTPRSVLEGPRVVAVLATDGAGAPRLEVGPEDAVTLTPVVLPPPQGAVGGTWRFCAFSVGSTTGYACAVPADVPGCQAELSPAADGSIAATPGALLAQCAAGLLALGGAAAQSLPAQLPDRFDVVFRYEPGGAAAAYGDTVELVSFRPAGAVQGPQANLPPDVPSRVLTVAGEAVPEGGTATAVLRSGVELELALQLGPPQSYVDENGLTRDETLFVSFFTTAGRFDYDRANGPDARVKLKHEKLAPGTTEARIWAVARDNRGGQTVVGPFVVEVGP